MEWGVRGGGVTGERRGRCEWWVRGGRCEGVSPRAEGARATAECGGALEVDPLAGHPAWVTASASDHALTSKVDPRDTVSRVDYTEKFDGQTARQ